MLNLLRKLKAARLVFAGLLALCLSGTALADSPVLDRVVKSGTLRVAMSGDQPPFNAISRDFSIIGFDADLVSSLKEPGARMQASGVGFRFRRLTSVS